jgi:tyrosyl-tRNA synthetase
VKKLEDVKELRNPELLARTTEQVYSVDELSERLKAGQKLRIKYGVDVTAPFLHLGHAVNLWMMRELQEQGHKLVFLIGDCTTKIGDPTGRSSTRPVMTDDTIETNAKEYVDQIARVVLTDPAVFEVRRNSEWYKTMPPAEFLALLSVVTHAKMISRDMFRQRIESGAEIYMHELIYPILQGYDSVMLNSDLTIVGTDQLFNESMGRFYQERFGQRPQVIVTSKITPGTDGKAKQSKSLNNYIALLDEPTEKFGKIMSIGDDLIVTFFEVYTDVPLADIRDLEIALAADLNPKIAKTMLAEKVVERYHGRAAAQAAAEAFHRRFSERELDDNLTLLEVPSVLSAVDLVKLARPEISRSEARRLLAQNGVTLCSAKLQDQPLVQVRSGDVLTIGKRQAFRLRTAEPRSAEP